MSNPRQIGFERRKTVEVVRRREEIDERQGGLHAARARRIVVPPHQRIEPDDAFASTPQSAHRRRERLGSAGVESVREDHHAGAGVNDPARVPAIERGETLADPRAAADALRH